jgi:hypothetical protein
MQGRWAMEQCQGTARLGAILDLRRVRWKKLSQIGCQPYWCSPTSQFGLLATLEDMRVEIGAFARLPGSAAR